MKMGMTYYDDAVENSSYNITSRVLNAYHTLIDPVHPSNLEVRRVSHSCVHCNPSVSRSDYVFILAWPNYGQCKVKRQKD